MTKASSAMVLSLGQLLEQQPAAPPASLVEPGLLPAQGILFVGGEPKVGKSLLVANLALSLAAGSDRLGFPVPAPRRVLVCQFEFVVLRGRRATGGNRSRSPRNGRWAVTVLDVPTSDSRASVAEISQHGQRSVVSVPPMAGQPSSVGGMVPSVPLSHPFVERLVGTLRRECLDRTLFWTTADLEAKLREFQKYFNEHR
jgi:hypothetical protein